MTGSQPVKVLLPPPKTFLSSLTPRPGPLEVPTKSLLRFASVGFFYWVISLSHSTLSGGKMALNIQSYVDYLNSIQPVEKPVKVLASYREEEVSVINNDPNTCFDPFGLPDHLIQKIVRLTDLMQEATDSPYQTPADILDEWDEELASEGDDIAADALATAIEKTLEMLPQQAEGELTALQIVRRRLITDNPWEVFEEERERLSKLPGFAEALELLFTDAIQAAKAHEQVQPELNRMIQWLIVSARNGLEAYREIEQAYQNSVDEAKHEVSLEMLKIKQAPKAAPHLEDVNFAFWDADGDFEETAARTVSSLQQAQSRLNHLKTNRPKHERGTRPVDQYRMYAKALRVVRKAGFLKAGNILRDLQLEASTPFADMENPDYIDPYTTEIDPEAEQYRIHISPIARTLLTSERPEVAIRKLDSGITVALREDDSPNYEQVAKDLKWEPEVLEAHVNAQEGFSTEPNDDIEEWVSEFWQETRDPVWMQIQQDFSSSDSYMEISQEARTYTDRLHELVDNTMRQVKSWLKVYLNPGDGNQRNEQIVDILIKLGSWEDEKDLRAYLRRLANKDWTLERKLASVAIQTVKRIFPKSQEAADFLAFLNELVLRGEKEVDIALIFLSVQNGIMFAEEAAQEIKLSRTVGDALTLYDFIEENEEEILANLNDRAPKRWEEPFELVAEIAEQGFKQAVGTGDPNSQEVKKTPEFIEGYIRAAMTSKSMSFRDESGYHNTFDESGWSNFRMKRSPKGTELYSQARSRKSTQRQAMAAFWKQYGLEQRRKAEGRIKSTWTEGKESGLILSNGRKVSFNVAVMKFNGGEFEHTAEEWVKIAGFLRTKKIGGYFTSLVEKKYKTA
jgi:hypothetical protein